MISNYIRGGQIFLHKIRMLKQVWDKTLVLAFILSALLSGFISYDKFSELDFYAGFTYIKALAAEATSTISPDKTSSTITATSNLGVYSNNIEPRHIIKHAGFKRRFNIMISTIISSAILCVSIMAGFAVIIIYLWDRFGKFSSEKDILRGREVLSPREVAARLKKANLASDIIVSGMPLVKGSETSHILITGTTGSGKTTCMNEILGQVRNQNTPAIIIDYTGQMTKKYYSESRGDVIINKSEVGAHSWDFWEDVNDEDNLAAIASALFANTAGAHDEMWNNASSQFFKDAVRFIARQEFPTIANLYTLLASATLTEVHNALKGTASAAMLDPANEKTAMSVRTNTIAFIEWMENFRETPRKIAISNWFTEKRLSKGSWLFLKSSPKQRLKNRNFHSILLDLCIGQIMELGENFSRRIWLVIDELPALKQLPSLPSALSEFRKYGGAIMASIQSPHQLFEIYGSHGAYAILDQFNTKFIFRTDEYNFANYLCKSFGEIEYKEQNENYSYGAHEIRDGVNISSHEKKKPLVTPDDLSSLDNLEAYVKLPMNDVKAVKIKLIRGYM